MIALTSSSAVCAAAACASVGSAVLCWTRSVIGSERRVVAGVGKRGLLERVVGRHVAGGLATQRLAQPLVDVHVAIRLAGLVVHAIRRDDRDDDRDVEHLVE